MFRSLMYSTLIVAIVATLWAYAAHLAAPPPQAMHPNAPSLALANVPAWSLGDVDYSS